MSTQFPNRALQMIVIYDKPKDYPGNVVTRRWNVGPDGRMTANVACDLHASVAAARAHIRHSWPWLINVPRGPSDDPCIVETWL